MAVAEPGASAARKRSDLPVRVVSAAVMLAAVGLAFWLGGWIMVALIVTVGLGILAEWTTLVLAFEQRFLARALWLMGGAGYVGLACYTALAGLAPRQFPTLVASVIMVDVGAYFAGRTFGGPKIAPAISPSKTWSGLGGAIVAASMFFVAMAWFEYRESVSAMGHYTMPRASIVAWQVEPSFRWQIALLFGFLTAIVAQSGDFFESWMKRRAGVKDSGRLIPGHGGLFDRADGLIAVLFVNGLVGLLFAMAR